MARKAIKTNVLEIIQLGSLGAAVVLAIIAAYGGHNVQTLFAVAVFSVTFAVFVIAYFYYRFVGRGNVPVQASVASKEFDTRRISREELAEKFKLNIPVALEPVPESSDLDTDLTDLNDADTQFRLKLPPVKQSTL